MHYIDAMLRIALDTNQ